VKKVEVLHKYQTKTGRKQLDENKAHNMRLAFAIKFWLNR